MSLFADQEETDKAIILKLRAEVLRHNHLYYNNNTPEISDTEYDMMFKQLQQLEKLYPDFVDPSSPTQTVGAKVTSGFKKVTHVEPMLSLDSVNTIKDLVAKLTRWKTEILRKRQGMPEENEPILVTTDYKYDGLAVELVYEEKDGEHKLVRASTRGDKFVGEDITANIVHVENVPLAINFDYLKHFKIKPSSTVVVYAEVIMPKPAFKTLNERCAKLDKPLFSSPRNAAAGSLRQKDPEVTKKRGLRMMAYDVKFDRSNESSIDHYWAVTLFNRIHFGKGFGLFERSLGRDNIDNIINALNSGLSSCFQGDTVEMRARLDFDIDGMVLKIDNSVNQKLLGYTKRAPRFAIAYKFPAKLAETTVTGLATSISRYGVITPLLTIEPVSIDGVEITTINLSNRCKLDRWNLHIGDRVTVERTNDVIPSLVAKAITEKSKDRAVSIPDTCPSCNGKLLKFPEDFASKEGFFPYKNGDTVCTNYHDCKTQVIERFSFFSEVLSGRAFKKATILHDVSESGWRSFYEFFNQHASMFDDVFISGEHYKFLEAISIPGIGKEAAKAIVEEIGVFNECGLTVKDLASPSLLDSLIESCVITKRQKKSILWYFGDLARHYDVSGLEVQVKFRWHFLNSMQTLHP